MKHLIKIVTLLVIFTSCGQAQESKQKDQSVYKTVDVSAFDKIMEEKKNEIVLDVRTPAETKEGTIPGAVEYNYFDDNFKEEISKLDKDKPVMVYCASGGRSGKTMEMMKDMGFKEVYNLSGGYGAWKAKH